MVTVSAAAKNGELSWAARAASQAWLPYNSDVLTIWPFAANCSEPAEQGD